jgi:hypothetical protein
MASVSSPSGDASCRQLLAFVREHRKPILDQFDPADCCLSLIDNRDDSEIILAARKLGSQFAVAMLLGLVWAPCVPDWSGFRSDCLRRAALGFSFYRIFASRRVIPPGLESALTDRCRKHLIGGAAGTGCNDFQCHKASAG